MSNRPKPTNLRILEGNPGKRPLNLNEPKPRLPKRTPSPPAILGAAGKREWRRVAKELVPLGLLTEIDVSGFTAYCFAYQHWYDSERLLAQEGYVVTTPNGFPVQSPYVGIANKAMQQMRAFMVEFGMTPASRSRIGVEPISSKAEDELEAWLFRDYQ